MVPPMSATINPPAVSAENAQYKLWCIVEDDNAPFSVTVPTNSYIADLKELVFVKRMSILRDVDAAGPVLWKPDEYVPMEPEGALLKRMKNRFDGKDIKNIAARLSAAKKLLGIFPEQPPEKYLHIYVRRPAASTLSPSSSDEFKLGGVAAHDPTHNPFHTKEWIAFKNNSNFFSYADSEVSRDPRPGCVLRLDNSSEMFWLGDSGPASAIFIRECYITWFTRFLQSAREEPMGKFALSSSPGCGKTFATNFISKMATTDQFLREKSILYQFRTEFYYIRSEKVFSVSRRKAAEIATLPDTFYLLDGLNADPVSCRCLTLFISSPFNNNFKHWHTHAQINPSYFPVWSLDELRKCRAVCYPNIDLATVEDRYRQYGGIARYMFWSGASEPPSIASVIADENARRSIHSVGEPSYLFPSSHMLLHISADENMHFQHVVLASRYVGVLLFSKYFKETLDKLKSMLGAEDALAGHLFECYVHFLFEYGLDEPLSCRSLEGDNRVWELQLPQRQVEVFDSVPQALLDKRYYVPLATNFTAIDALTMDTGLQYCVTQIHPVKGVQAVKKLAAMYPDGKLPLLFIVPESIAAEFKRQPILTANGHASKQLPCVLQSVAGLPLGIDTYPAKKRRIMP